MIPTIPIILISLLGIVGAIFSALKGKTIVALGTRGTGKTHLLTFLSTGQIPEAITSTVGTKKFQGRTIELDNIKFNLAEGIDVAGSTSGRLEWKKQFDAADIVLYLVRLDQMFLGESSPIQRVRDDIQHISSWPIKGKKRLIIVGTHFDLVPSSCNLFCDFSEGWQCDNNKYANVHDEFCKLPIVMQFMNQCGGASVKIVVGSMKDIKGTQALVYRLLEEVA